MTKETAKIHIVSTGKPASEVRPIRELRHSSSCLECLGSKHEEVDTMTNIYSRASALDQASTTGKCDVANATGAIEKSVTLISSENVRISPAILRLIMTDYRKNQDKGLMVRKCQ